MLRNILLGVGIFAALFSMLIFSGKLPIGSKDQGPRGDVVMWGTFPEEGMNVITQAFNVQAKDYAVRYKYVPEQVFKQRLLEALASGVGPDIILAPYQFVLSQQNRITPFPIAEKNFKDLFVDGSFVLYDVAKKGALGLPVGIDPMVLFYNRTLFSKHGIVNPPSYWDEVTSVTQTLTLKENGRFVESGIALGTPEVSYAKDIIMAIVSQLGQVPVVKGVDQNGVPFTAVLANDPVTTDSQILPLATTARFFTQFGDPGQQVYSWSQTQEGKTSDVFISEKLAMYIGYAGELATLRSRNPRAEIEMTYLPQTKGYNTFATGMQMYAVATLSSSKNPQAALTIASQFSGAGVAPSLAPIVGAVPALRQYALTPGLDPVIAKSMLVAKGWYDVYYEESTSYIKLMISDIINYRQGVNDAAAMFVSRMRDLHNKI